jgi:hypothetical protein
MRLMRFKKMKEYRKIRFVFAESYLSSDDKNGYTLFWMLDQIWVFH